MLLVIFLFLILRIIQLIANEDLLANAFTRKGRGTMEELISSLYEQVTSANAGEGHVQLYGIKNDSKAAAIISVYYHQRPANVVLDELYQWAKAFDLEIVVEKIDQLEKWGNS